MIAARLAWEDEAVPLIEQLQNFNVPPNRKELVLLESEPVMDALLSIGVTAYREVSTCRQVGFDVGLIPVTAVDAYLDRQVDRGELDEEIAALVKPALLVADREWLRAHYAKRPRPEKGNKR